MVEHDDNSSLRESYSRLLSLAVHEFRTPAGVATGWLRMVQRDTNEQLSDRQQKAIDEVEKACTKMVALISELSEISRLDRGEAPFKDEPIDLFQLIREVAAGVHEAEDREVQLTVRGDVSGALLKADPVRLRAAFEAFFRAILREQPNRASVAADCRKDGDGSAVVVVARDTDVQRSYDAPRVPVDQTCGEPPRPRDPKLGAERGGLGLIFPIACRIVARYGGFVWAPGVKDQSDPGLAERGALIISFPLPAEQRT